MLYGRNLFWKIVGIFEYKKVYGHVIPAQKYHDIVELPPQWLVSARQPSSDTK